jgi:PEP-CTERM motif
MRAVLLSVVLIGFAARPAAATSFMIGDNDGYGIGICDGCDHPFNGVTAGFDGRSQDEKDDVAGTGVKYTDTYSTTHGEFSPPDQTGTIATFLFRGLGNAWTVGHLEVDAADFQATRFGAVLATFNGIVVPFNFDDGFPHTAIHYVDLSQPVLDSINATGQLRIQIDRNGSIDFYGFDYLKLNDFASPALVPEPASLILVSTGLIAVAARWRRRGVKRPQ